MSSIGVKRGSGSDVEKNPLGDVELSDEDAVKLQTVQKDIARVELALERHAQKKMEPVYTRRRPIVKAINKFWPVALLNHPMVAMHIQHASDQAALSYLEDLWLVRDAAESRCFTLEFHFKENPYFSNSVLKKEYKFMPPPVEADDKPDADGITETMLEFTWERDVEPQATKIEWKDDERNLTKLHARPAIGGGSFFNFFEVSSDPFELGVSIANDVFPEAIEYFLGQAGGDDSDSDEESDDDEDEDEEEIDLEKPRPKKQKKA
ncbi:uncharacterized protein BXZ73DRAFT_93386 [Epithele typhae]|uniref:uncharacterized protein n=1 Tax=Epithele typhae TaxID=378194 RepID=UPI002008B2F9|nr:uncharacterized protein BXZ73DRAFT_93386 [Epithele typhae]KAH9911431.1 hypothetical protein BXZ73DRAFT_93386 [Epithele typhae]